MQINVQDQFKYQVNMPCTNSTNVMFQDYVIPNVYHKEHFLSAYIWGYGIISKHLMFLATVDTVHY